MSSWREQFPCFKTPGFPVAFLDSAASAQKPACVLQAMEEFAVERYANIHRGVHSLAEASTAQYERARLVVAKFIGAPCAESIVFTSGTTASVNLAAYTLARSVLSKQTPIFATAMEHHSNFLPWARAAEELGSQFTILPIDNNGELDRAAFERAVKSMDILSRPAFNVAKPTGLLVITHASNVLGAVNPLKELIALARQYGLLVFVDGAQAVAHLGVNVKELDCDFYAFSGHKVYGPTGVGALYIRAELAELLPPFMLGGGMVHKVGSSYGETSWAPMPHRFEAGTPAIVEAVGLGAAVEFVSRIGFAEIQKHERALTEYLLKELKMVPGIKLYGEPKERIGVVSFNIGEIHPHDVGSILSAQGVAVRVGHHCAQPLMNSLGILACVRVSLGVYNNEADVDALINALKVTVKKLS